MIYLDNSATTALSERAKERMYAVMECYGNPSSRHSLGLDARKIIENARQQVGTALGLSHPSAENLLFTSCGSESNNMAILGSVYAKTRRRANKIITTNSEHSSVENVMRKLEGDGFEVVRVPTVNGIVDEELLMSEIDGKTLLLSLMLVNNETGAAYDVKRLFALASRKNPEIITHCDAVQGFLKLPMSLRSLGASMVSVSAHKIHGPKGVGALYISPDIIKQKKIVPYLIGGGQEGGLRSGTENVIGIAGFGEAAEEGYKNLSANINKMTSLRNLCERCVIEAGARPNIPKGARAPHLLSVTLPSIKSETMLNFLSSKGSCVSSGSACSSHAKALSSSLLGFGLTPSEADTTIRISFSEYNTEEEINTFVSALKEGIDTLVKIRR